MTDEFYMLPVWPIVKNKECCHINENKCQWVAGEGNLGDIRTSQMENMNGVARGYQGNLVGKTKCFAKNPPHNYYNAIRF